MIAFPDSVSSPPFCSTAVENPDTDVPLRVISSVGPATLTPDEVNQTPVPLTTVIVPNIVDGWIEQW